MGRLARLNRERAPRVVRAYVDAAREILPTAFSADSCLNGTRVCIEALAAHGVNARPLAVDLVVANAVANRMFVEHDGWPKADADVKRWMDAGAWTIVIDPSSRGDGWSHHLVATTEDLVVDSALGQTSRPHKSIDLPWVVAFPRGGFAATRDTIVYDAPGDVTIGLRARPDVTDYHRISGFQRHRPNMEVAARVATRMADLLTIEEE